MRFSSLLCPILFLFLLLPRLSPAICSTSFEVRAGIAPTYFLDRGYVVLENNGIDLDAERMAKFHKHFHLPFFLGATAEVRVCRWLGFFLDGQMLYARGRSTGEFIGIDFVQLTTTDYWSYGAFGGIRLHWPTPGYQNAYLCFCPTPCMAFSSFVGAKVGALRRESVKVVATLNAGPPSTQQLFYPREWVPAAGVEIGVTMAVADWFHLFGLVEAIVSQEIRPRNPITFPDGSLLFFEHTGALLSFPMSLGASLRF